MVTCSWPRVATTTVPVIASVAWSPRIECAPTTGTPASLQTGCTYARGQSRSCDPNIGASDSRTYSPSQPSSHVLERHQVQPVRDIASETLAWASVSLVDDSNNPLVISGDSWPASTSAAIRLMTFRPG